MALPDWTAGVRLEIIALLNLSIWNVMAYAGNFSWGLVSLAFVGHTSTSAMGAVGLGLSYTNVTGRSPMIGIGTGVMTLLSQANGANNQARVGELVRRMFVVLVIVAVPVIALWCTSGYALALAGQSELITPLTQRYTTIRAIGFPFFMCFVPMRVWRRSVLDVRSTCVVTLAVGVLHVPLAYILVQWLGVDGAGLSVALCDMLACLLMFAYIRHGRLHHQMWGEGFSRKSFDGLKEIAAFAGPSTAMLLAEWWASEILILLAGLLGPKEAAAQPALFSAAAMAFTMPLGISLAGSARIGNILGQNRAGAAKLCASTLYLLAIACTLCTSTLILIFRKSWGRVFSSDEEVIELVSELTPFMAVHMVCDGLQSAGSGALRGVGLLKEGMIVNLASFYLLALPAAAVLTFYFKLGIIGLWWGILVGMVAQSTLLGVLVWKVDWEKQCAKAVDRATKDVKHTPAIAGGNDGDDGIELGQVQAIGSRDDDDEEEETSTDSASNDVERERDDKGLLANAA